MSAETMECVARLDAKMPWIVIMYVASCMMFDVSHDTLPRSGGSTVARAQQLRTLAASHAGCISGLPSWVPAIVATALDRAGQLP